MEASYLIAAATEQKDGALIVAATITGLVSGAIGAIGGFALSWLKHRHEIKKLKAEVIVLSGTFLKDCQAARFGYNKAAAECGDFTSELCDRIKNSSSDLAAINDAREAVCTSLTLHVIPTFIADFEWQIARAKDKEVVGELALVLVDARAELARFQKWVAIINYERMLTELHKAKLQITARTFRPIQHAVARLPADVRNAEERLLNREIESLVQGVRTTSELGVNGWIPEE